MSGDPLDTLIDTVGSLAAASTLVEAVHGWRAPWRVAIVGRVGTGKSTLCNLLTGVESRRTGLGGVTTEVGLERAGEVEVLDTPGIDDEHHALCILQPLLETVDGVIWVIDGLQPLTATERRVMAAALIEGTPLHILVSRLDLTEPDEVDAVLHRVETLTAAHRPLSVRRADLRHLEAPPDGLLDRVDAPRRQRILVDALEALVAELDASPAAADLPEIRDQLRALWSNCVRRTAEDVEAAIDAGEIDHKERAVRALAAAGSAAISRFEEQLALAPAVADHLQRHGPPPLPLPSVRSRSPLRYVLAGLSGAEGAKRALKSTAAQWLADGEIILIEWVDAGADLAAEHAWRQELRHAIDCARRHVQG